MDDAATNDRINELRERYRHLCHAMQTGVAFTMEREPAETTPKHLRVGVNVAMCDHAALVTLLVSKGLITEVEYFEQLVVSMEREVKLYQERISNRAGAARITLI